MVYLKVLLNTKRKKQDSIYPIVVRLTYQRATTFISTGVRIHIDHWDEIKSMVKSSTKNAQHLNSRILDCYSSLQKLALKLEDESNFSFEELQRQLKPEKNKPKEITVNEFALTTIKNLIAEGKTGNALVYQSAWSRFHKFNKEQSIMFSQLDYKSIESFKRHLVSEDVKINSISNYLRTLRALYNRALKEGIVSVDSYPFKHIKIENERTLKRAISFNDLSKLIVNKEKETSNEWHSVNYFFLSVSLIGISFTDLAYLKTNDICDNRIIYVRRKTNKLYNIKITKFCRDLLSLYDNVNSKYVLPILADNVIEDSLEAHKIIKQWIKTTNHYLNKIGKKLELPKITTYVARHSWATTAKRLGYSNEIIAEALGHEYGNKVTGIYLDSFEESVIDEVNEKVLKSLKY